MNRLRFAPDDAFDAVLEFAQAVCGGDQTDTSGNSGFV
jgi:hypothetical protein